MSESLTTGLMLLAVGMLTVFTVLGIVVLTGKMLIVVMNRVAPAPVTVSPPSRKPDNGPLSRRKIAVIASALNLMMGSDTRIEKIERLEP